MPKKLDQNAQSELPTLDVPMPVHEAVKVCFPYGGLTKTTLFDAIRSGHLAYEKLGRSYFITRRDVEKWRTASRFEAKVTKSDREVRFQEAREACLRTAKRLQKGLPPG